MITAERKYGDLFRPADRGEWTLPQEVANARETVARLATAYAAIPQPPNRQALHDTAVHAALTADNPCLVDVTGLLDYPRVAAERDTLTEVLRVASERADLDLAAAVVDHRDDIITDHLRTAGQSVWSSVMKATRALDGVDTDQVNVIVGSPKPVRDAWLELETLATRYTLIRQAVSRLLLHTGPQPEYDVDGDHSEFEPGLCALAGPGWKGLPMAERRPKLPWPDDPRARLVWFARKGIRPWWPTTTERDQAWMIAHKDAYDRMQDQKTRHKVAHEWSRSYA